MNWIERATVKIVHVLGVPTEPKVKSIIIGEFKRGLAELYSEWENSAETKQDAIDDYYWHGAGSFKDFLEEKLK